MVSLFLYVSSFTRLGRAYVFWQSLWTFLSRHLKAFNVRQWEPMSFILQLSLCRDACLLGSKSSDNDAETLR